MISAGALVFAACSESTTGSSCGSGTSPSLVGTYKLASYTIGTNTVDTTMGATGQLRFYTSNYAFDATLPVVGALADSGTYVVTGTKCLSQTSVMQQGTSTGTFTLSGTTAGSIFTFTGTNNLANSAVGVVAVKQ